MVRQAALFLALASLVGCSGLNTELTCLTGNAIQCEMAGGPPAPREEPRFISYSGEAPMPFIQMPNLYVPLMPAVRNEPVLTSCMPDYGMPGAVVCSSQ